MKYAIIPLDEFKFVQSGDIGDVKKLKLLAEMCRLNTLTEVKLAGSGHLGSSLSAMDVVVFLYYSYMNTVSVGMDHKNRDVYFSSKGHDVPGLYAVLYSLGIISEEKLLTLRKLDGLDGHPDVSHRGIEANTGSLGMGISKGRGIAYSKAYRKFGGRVFVLTGDGEFQEGQNFEALQNTIHQGINNITVIMDHNKVQSDKEVEKIIHLGAIEEKVRAFGWHVLRADGHDFDVLKSVFSQLETVTDKPKFLILDTIKGKGISFMEHPAALLENKGIYKWHSGAPSDEMFQKGYNELLEKINSLSADILGRDIRLKDVEIEKKPASGVSDEYVSAAYGEALVDTARKNDGFVVLDADLAADCKVRDFEIAFPDRFIECGIAEQDMVSMAGGIALQGLVPVVNSFASFLASRGNEQIYNNATEHTKVVYACHYAGIIPAGPGKSHQSVRDISLFGAIPNCQIIEPVNAEEMHRVVSYAIEDCNENCMIRIPIGPSPRIVGLPENYEFTFGKGTKLMDGKGVAIIAYGPVLMHEALNAAELLEKDGMNPAVINMPWLNRFNVDWCGDLNDYETIFVVEDHMAFGGLSDNLIDFCSSNSIIDVRKIKKVALRTFPKYGTPPEVLRYHSLDGDSIAAIVRKAFQK